MSAAHEHKWKAGFHLDGCHWYEWRYGCSCGAARVLRDEREFTDGDGYGFMHADDDCARCRELMDGAERQHADEIYEPAAGGRSE